MKMNGQRQFDSEEEEEWRKELENEREIERWKKSKRQKCR